MSPATAEIGVSVGPPQCAAFPSGLGKPNNPPPCVALPSGLGKPSAMCRVFLRFGRAPTVCDTVSLRFGIFRALWDFPPVRRCRFIPGGSICPKAEGFPRKCPLELRASPTIVMDGEGVVPGEHQAPLFASDVGRPQVRPAPLFAGPPVRSDAVGPRSRAPVRT